MYIFCFRFAESQCVNIFIPVNFVFDIFRSESSSLDPALSEGLYVNPVTN